MNASWQAFSQVPALVSIMGKIAEHVPEVPFGKTPPPLVTAEEQELHRLEAERLRLEIEAAAATDAAAEVPAEKCECETHTGTERINGVRCCERCGKPR